MVEPVGIAQMIEVVYDEGRQERQDGSEVCARMSRQDIDEINDACSARSDEEPQVPQTEKDETEGRHGTEK